MMNNIEYINGLKIDWNLYKGATSGNNANKSKSGFVDFIIKVNEVGFELVSEYKNATSEVEIKHNNVLIKRTPAKFKGRSYNQIKYFLHRAIENGDKFIEFVGVDGKNSLIAKIETVDGGIIEISIEKYNNFIETRDSFFKKAKSVDAEIITPYLGAFEKITLKIDSIVLKDRTPSEFTSQTIKSINKFKLDLIENKDKFIEFNGASENNVLIAKIETRDGGIIEKSISVYSKFYNAREKFEKLLEEFGVQALTPYLGSMEKILLKWDDAIIETTPSDFKIKTLKSALVNIKKCEVEGDKFIKFSKYIINGLYMIIKEGRFNEEVEVYIGNYNDFIKSRKDTYDYCKENNIEVLSPYIGSDKKILFDFNCGHSLNWAIPPNLKKGARCPICSESRGEKIIREYCDKNNIKYDTQKTFQGMRGNRELKCDIFIPEYNLVIEYDGEQHYRPVDFASNGEKWALEEFKKIQKRDKLKNEYCRENKINMLRIPYWEKDNIDGILDKYFSEAHNK